MEKMENVKSLLKSGDTLITRNGSKYKVFLDYETKNYGIGIFANVNGGGFNDLSVYDDDLNNPENEDYDIVKIYEPKYPSLVMSESLDDYDLVWEEKKIKEMTVEEIEKELNIPKGTLRVKGDD